MKRTTIHHHKISDVNNKSQDRKPNFELVWFRTGERYNFRIVIQFK